MSADMNDSDGMDTTEPTGRAMRDVCLNEIQRRIGRGEYHVDTQAVAAAILRRLIVGRDLPAADGCPQDPCS